MGEKEPTLPGVRMDPGVMQVALLNEIAERLLKLEENALESRTEGITEPLSYTITATKRILRASKPWFSTIIVNDGPNDVNVLSNSTLNEVPHLVRVGETYRIDMGRGIIKDVQVWCDVGTALIRLVGVR